jgi:uncharacterized protein (TIGR00661 family)
MKKFLFLIQGEGRGHLTQAVALAEILTQNGHQIVAACVGSSQRRTLPDFFTNNIQAPVHLFPSPNFVTDKKEKKIRLTQSIITNLKKSKTYFKSLKTIDKWFECYLPDIVINFYEPLAGLYKLAYRPSCIFWSIGHQYLIFHEAFPFPKGRNLERWLFRQFTQITALGSSRLLALSFGPLNQASNPKIEVMPPLLRKMVQEIHPVKGDFFLAYMVNSGYAENVIHFASLHPDIQIKAFWDCRNKPKQYQPVENLTFHQLDDRLFLEKMAACKGLLSTAGFESICEAMYYGKPVWMVPLAGQYEQLCNAHDAYASGAGHIGEDFNFAEFERFINTNHPYNTSKTQWLSSFEKKILPLLNFSNHLEKV